MLTAEKFRAFITEVPDKPLYNIKAVGQRTGIPTATLRAWERRHGLPNPQRSDQGYRLYSERDMVLLSWLRDRLHKGASIAQAVRELRQIIEQDQSTGNPTSLPSPEAYETNAAAPDGQLSRYFDLLRSPSVLRDELVQAIQDRDAARIQHLINETLALYTLDTSLLCVVHSAVKIASDSAGLAIIEQNLDHLCQAQLSTAYHDQIALVGLASEQTGIALRLMALLLHSKQVAVQVFLIQADEPISDTLSAIDPPLALAVWYTLTPPDKASVGNMPLAWASPVAREPTAADDSALIYLGNNLRDIIQHIIIHLAHERPITPSVIEGRGRSNKN